MNFQSIVDEQEIVNKWNKYLFDITKKDGEK